MRSNQLSQAANCLSTSGGSHRPFKVGARDGIRTRDDLVGNEAFYQLNYSRRFATFTSVNELNCGAEGWSRTNIPGFSDQCLDRLDYFG